MKRHYVVAGWTLGTGPSGAARRLQSILDELPPWLDPAERVTLLHARDVTPRAPASGSIRLEPVDLPAAPTWRRVLAESRVLRRVLDALGADVLDLGTLPVPSRLPCPVVLTLHDLRDLRAEVALRRRPRWIARHVLKRSVHRAQAVVVPSAFTAEELRATLGNLLPPIKVVPGGIDPALLSLTPTAPRGRPYFLHVGHLEPRKNLLMLLSAYARFVEDAAGDADADALPALVLVGRDAGAEQMLRERAALLELVPHLHFEGVVPESHLRALYAGATAVLVPSSYEGYGLPLLEALAVGVPVVAARAGALPEVGGKVAHSLPADDVEAWAEALAAWHAEPRRPEASAARKQHAAAATWSICARATLEVWRASAKA